MAWKYSITSWVIIIFAMILLICNFISGLNEMIGSWDREEYSHGSLMPIIAIFFAWQMKAKIAVVEFSGTYFGAFFLILGLLIGIVGSISTIYVVVEYAFLISLFGLVLTLVGWKGISLIWVSLIILIFMIPLPQFLHQNLSQQLQLISSSIGVDVIRFFGVSVFLEGNVIDLGNYKLQVVDACSGLRYLFPLMSFGFICAYLFKVPFWQRALVFLSTVPITILMNSFRIGVIGVLVNRWGTEQAEGFLHDFEGWVIFMACVAILFFEMWLLNKIFGKDKRSLREVFGLEFPEPTPKSAVFQRRSIPKSFIASLLILVVSAFATLGINERTEIIPDRVSFSSFPEQLGEWQGKKEQLDAVFLKGLPGLSDHVISDYKNFAGKSVNLYAAYYESQRAGGSVHSPKSCLPGGGWVIEDMHQVTIEGLSVAGKPVIANRVEIAKGDYKQLVYYWFQQRGRSISNEYLLKWYLFWDSLTKQRSDGSLVRLTTFIEPGEDWEMGEKRIKEFAQAVGNELKDYIPE